MFKVHMIKNLEMLNPQRDAKEINKNQYILVFDFLFSLENF